MGHFLEYALNFPSCKIRLPDNSVLSLFNTGESANCPICCGTFTVQDIKAASLFMRNVLSDIKLKCPSEGCGKVTGYDMIKIHKEPDSRTFYITIFTTDPRLYHKYDGEKGTP